MRILGSSALFDVLANPRLEMGFWGVQVSRASVPAPGFSPEAKAPQSEGFIDMRSSEKAQESSAST